MDVFEQLPNDRVNRLRSIDYSHSDAKFVRSPSNFDQKSRGSALRCSQNGLLHQSIDNSSINNYNNMKRMNSEAKHTIVHKNNNKSTNNLLPYLHHTKSNSVSPSMKSMSLSENQKLVPIVANVQPQHQSQGNTGQ